MTSLKTLLPDIVTFSDTGGLELQHVNIWAIIQLTEMGCVTCGNFVEAV